VDTVQIEIEERPEGMVARVSGEVDLANASHFKDAFQPALRNCRNVILDVRNLRYIDSTGLHVLIDANKGLQQNNCQLVVVGASSGFAKLMSILHLDWPLVSSVEEAMGRIRSKSSGTAAAE
jgi:anti-anti-sigma factor